jgi:hypothetical protein
VEVERRRRIRVACWAYAYEVLDVSLVSDHRFDEECKLIDPKVSTGNPRLDSFFRKTFSAHTGQWVHKHPDITRLCTVTSRLVASTSKEPYP